MKNAVFWDVTPYGFRSVLRLLDTVNVVPRSVHVTLMLEAIRPSEVSILIRATRPNIPEDGILGTIMI
jgi:hypothetical protein